MMRMPPFVLHSPKSITEAMSIAETLLDIGEDFDWISGGTDLLPNYKWHLNAKPSVISLAGVEEMNKLSETHIGGMVRLHDLANDESTHPLIRQATLTIASVMIRRSGTVAGNICLDTRCFWFNQTEEWRRSIEWCYKCDCDTSADCRVIPNQNTLCVATYQADLAPVLMCLNATIHLSLLPVLVQCRLKSSLNSMASKETSSNLEKSFHMYPCQKRQRIGQVHTVNSGSENLGISPKQGLQ